MKFFDRRISKFVGIVSMVPVAGLLATAASTAPVAAKEFPPAIAKLVKAAKAEGQFNVMWGSSLGYGKGAKIIESAFNKYYGTNVKFRWTPDLIWAAMAQKFAQELKAGQPAFVDFALGGSGQVEFYYSNKVLMPIDWRPLMPHLSEAMIKKITSPDGSLVTFYNRVPSIIYNTNFISKADAPRTLKDLLNPKWRGKISSTPYGFGFGQLVGHKSWGKEKILAYTTDLAKNLGGVMRCGEYDRVTSGEFWIFALACSPGRIQMLIDKGAPMAMVEPLDAIAIDHAYLGVPKNSVHPNISKLFIAWTMTRDGQDKTYQVSGMDSFYLKGSRSGPALEAAAKKSGIPYFDMDVHYLIENKGWSKIQRAAAKMFRESSKKKK